MAVLAVTSSAAVPCCIAVGRSWLGTAAWAAGIPAALGAADSIAVASATARIGSASVAFRAGHTAAAVASAAWAALDTTVPSADTSAAVERLPLDSLGVQNQDILAERFRIGLVAGCTFRIEEWAQSRAAFICSYLHVIKI